MLDKPKSRASKRVRNRVQTSYLRPQLLQAETALQALRHELDGLQSSQGELLQRLDAAVEGCETADACMALWAACHLGRHSQQLQHMQRRLLTTVEALPPPELWDGRESPLARWSSEELRFALYSSSLNLQTLSRAGQEGNEKLMAYTAKYGAFAKFQLAHNPETWLKGVKRCNLLTGEPAPEGWYHSAVASIPSSALPAPFMWGLQAGLAEYRRKETSILQRRDVLQRQLLHVLSNVSHTASALMETSAGAGAGATDSSAGVDSQETARFGAHQLYISSRHAVLQSIWAQHGPVFAHEDTSGHMSSSQLGRPGLSGCSIHAPPPCDAAPALCAEASPPSAAWTPANQGQPCAQVAVRAAGGAAAGDYLCQALELLAQIDATFAEQLWAQTFILPLRGHDFVKLSAMVRVVTHIGAAVLPYHMDIPTISEALCERFFGDLQTP